MSCPTMFGMVGDDTDAMQIAKPRLLESSKGERYKTLSPMFNEANSERVQYNTS